MIKTVWEKCVEAVGYRNVLVATDDDKIYAHCIDHKINVQMTSSECLTGTDRIAEFAEKFNSDIKGEGLETYLNFLKSDGTDLSKSISDQFAIAKEKISSLNEDFTSQISSDNNKMLVNKRLTCSTTQTHSHNRHEKSDHPAILDGVNFLKVV